MLAGEGGTQRLLSEVSPVLRWSPVGGYHYTKHLSHVGGGLSLHPDISFHHHCSVAFYHCENFDINVTFLYRRWWGRYAGWGYATTLAVPEHYCDDDECHFDYDEYHYDDDEYNCDDDVNGRLFQWG